MAAICSRALCNVLREPSIGLVFEIFRPTVDVCKRVSVSERFKNYLYVNSMTSPCSSSRAIPPVRNFESYKRVVILIRVRRKMNLGHTVSCMVTRT